MFAAVWLAVVEPPWRHAGPCRGPDRHGVCGHFGVRNEVQVHGHRTVIAIGKPVRRRADRDGFDGLRAGYECVVDVVGLVDVSSPPQGGIGLCAAPTLVPVVVGAGSLLHWLEPVNQTLPEDRQITYSCLWIHARRHYGADALIDHYTTRLGRELDDFLADLRRGVVADADDEPADDAARSPFECWCDRMEGALRVALGDRGTGATRPE